MPLHRAVNVVPVGIAMGLIVIAMIFARNVAVAIPLMVLIGALAGFFVVPMNALLQHRGHILMGAGHSIAVQNFNENLSILIMLGVYALLISLQSLDLHGDRAVRRVRRHHHGAGAPAPSQQPAQRPDAEHSVGRAPLAGRRDWRWVIGDWWPVNTAAGFSGDQLTLMSATLTTFVHVAMS